MSTTTQPQLPLADEDHAGADLAAYHLPIGKVHVDQLQVRKFFDGDELAELAASIATHGLQQPIVVRPAVVRGEQGYLIVAGERRYRALLKLGRKTIPCIVRADLEGAERRQLRAIQLVENLQRADLSLVETCEALTLLVDEIGVTAASEQMGKDKSWVSRHAGVLKLWQPAVTLLREGYITTVEIVHDLAALQNLNESMAQHLAGLYRNPPAHREAPTRAEVRAALQRERSEIEHRAEMAEKMKQRQIDLDNQRGADGGEEPDVTRAVKVSAPAAPTPAPAPTPRPEQDPQQQMKLDEQRLADRVESDAQRAYSDQLAGEMFDLTRRVAEHFGLHQDEENDGTWLDSAGEQTALEVDTEFSLNHLLEARPGMDLVRYTLRLPELTRAEIEQMLARLKAPTAGAGSSLQSLAEVAELTVPKADLKQVSAYLKKAVKAKPGEHVKAAWLFDQYREWCNATGTRPLSAQAFAKTVEATGIAKRRSNSGFQYLDITPRAAT